MDASQQISLVSVFPTVYNMCVIREDVQPSTKYGQSYEENGVVQ